MFYSALKTLAVTSIIAATSTAAFASGSDLIFFGVDQTVTTQIELNINLDKAATTDIIAVLTIADSSTDSVEIG